MFTFFSCPLRKHDQTLSLICFVIVFWKFFFLSTFRYILTNISSFICGSKNSVCLGLFANLLIIESIRPSIFNQYTLSLSYLFHLFLFSHINRRFEIDQPFCFFLLFQFISNSSLSFSRFFWSFCSDSSILINHLLRYYFYTFKF